MNTEQLHSNFWHRSRLPLFEFSGLLLLSPIALHYSFFQKRVCTLRTPILCSFASFLPGDTFFSAGSTAGLSLFYIYEVSIVEVIESGTHSRLAAFYCVCFMITVSNRFVRLDTKAELIVTAGFARHQSFIIVFSVSSGKIAKNPILLPFTWSRSPIILD